MDDDETNPERLARNDNPALPGWPRGMSERLAAAYVGLSRSFIRHLYRMGEFPAPVSLTRGRQVWFREDLDEWLDDKGRRRLPMAVCQPRHAQRSVSPASHDNSRQPNPEFGPLIE